MRLPTFALGILLLCSTPCIASAAERNATPLQQGDAPSERPSKPKKRPPTNAQIKQLLIDESIAAYSGNCPCPYNTAPQWLPLRPTQRLQPRRRRGPAMLRERRLLRDGEAVPRAAR
jgi:hypothetical protein